ncbi:MAG: hypothetical protein WBM98_10195 [Maribacter sp.]|uniref:hypothetical protein n=1 Tax=Maribacter sp. TaxID=1897614 RepID=UPI003C742B7D
MTTRLLLILFILFFPLYSCNKSKPTKSDMEIAFTQDTLAVGFTYWWPESGPFLGLCGDELTLVFSGTVTEILQPTDEAGPLYTSQKGFIKIDRVFKIKELGPNIYANQQYFVSDCFDGLDLRKGDQVLVCCYDYENDLSIPGGKSILKIDALDDPLITSIKIYIDADQNPKKIKMDMKLWEKYGLDDALRRILECEESK